ncbi:MAG: hypothetical protein IKH88_07095 [Prevotella sp.]|nr:hypothetical protein [Prevotella sp.]
MKHLQHLSIVVIAGCILLFCSSCTEEPLCPDESHPHIIDLGLPDGTLWACCNVGAPSPEAIGGFYSWGETNVKPIYDEEHYQHGELSNMIPQRMGNIAGTEYDVASARMGAPWKMPTSNQWNELIDYCNWDWVKYKGRHGWQVTGPNGNKIFIPAGGMKGKSWYEEDEFGYYWTSNFDREDGPIQFFTNGGCRETKPSISYDTYGFNVRPIATP